MRLKDRPRNDCGKEKHSKGDQQKYILHWKISLPRVFPLGFIQKKYQNAAAMNVKNNEAVV